MSKQSDGTPTDAPRDRPTEAVHLADVDDGCGCVEVWEHLSERRASD